MVDTPLRDTPSLARTESASGGVGPGRPVSGRRGARRSRRVGVLLAALVVLSPMPVVLAEEVSPAKVSATAVSIEPSKGFTLGGDEVTIGGLDLSSALFDQIEAAGSFSLALTREGTLYSWGKNNYGQLGNGTMNSSDVAMPVDMTGALAGQRVTHIATGSTNAVVLTSSGRLYGWGLNVSGQLGADPALTGNNVLKPMEIDTRGALIGLTIAKISAEGQRTSVLTTTGDLYAWGQNAAGQLGNGTLTNTHVPVLADRSGAMGGAPITDFSAGANTTLAVAGGRAYAWGVNNNGELGNGPSGQSSLPVAVDASGALAGRTVVDVGAGSAHSVARTQDGQVFAWGYNLDGQLGAPGTPSLSRTPLAVDTSGALQGKTVTAIVAGYYQTFAIDGDGRMYAWGSGTLGQLGIGSAPLREFTPILIDDSTMQGSRVARISSGYQHTLAVDATGRVYGWGRADQGELGVGETAHGIRTSPTLVLTHGVYFDRPEFPGTEVSVDPHTQTIRATTPAHAPEDVNVYVVPYFVAD